ncbi:MAG: hypothetical protein GY830_07750 [Bacteroidetes bacterium]|nr:hypothetical protein [Bacteroidota bacterium]
MNKYCTDKITNVLCQYFNNEINKNEKVIKDMIEVATKEELAEYILDSFNKASLLSEAIGKIPKEDN